MELTWEQYETMVSELDKKIRSTIPSGPIGLLGIPRGGLLVALYLTYFDLRYEIINSYNPMEFESRIVVVDDVLETGETREKWNYLSSVLPNQPVIFAVLIDKSAYYHIPAADISVLNMDKKEWVIFPYERKGNFKENESMKERGY